MVHATGHDDGENGAKAPQTNAEKGAAFTKETLKNPEVQGKVKLALVKGGLALKERAETPENRVSRAQELMSQLTPEAQMAFIEDSQGFVHRMMNGVLNQLTIGGRSIWRLAIPSVAPDWASLETYHEEELFAYIGLGALNVEEDVAKQVDGILKDDVKMLKVISFLCHLLPEIGEVLAEVFGTIAHLAEAPANFLTETLPEVREAVNNGGVVGEAIAAERGQINGTVPPQLRLINTPKEAPAPTTATTLKPASGIRTVMVGTKTA